MFPLTRVRLFSDRTYFVNLFRIALPIIAQNLVSSLLNMVDVTMIGQLGETTVAAVGLANQIFFLMVLMMFGINGGAGIFVAQLWGKRDTASIHRVQGVALTLGLSAGLLFTLIALVFPTQALGIYSSDPAVVKLGASYLRIVGFSYLATAITLSYSAVLRGVGLVRIPMIISIVVISLKTLLNYGLILGNLGLPALGAEGAALATVISRTIEVIVLLVIVYTKRLPAAAHLRELLSGLKRSFMLLVLKTSLPVVANETLWALGQTVYTIVYARIGTESIAAVNIAATIENMAFVIFIGMAEACGILIGNRIGAGNESEAFDYAQRTLIIGTIGAILMGGIVWFISAPLLGIYNISDGATANAQAILHVMSFALWVKVTNLLLIVGILRAGGDTRFSMILDAGSVWLVGVPLAVLGATVFHLPVYGVYLLIVMEEAVKFGVGLYRFFSKKWISNLASMVET